MTSRFTNIRFRRLFLWPIAAFVLVLVVALVPPRTDADATLLAALYAWYLVMLLLGVRECLANGIAPGQVVGRVPRESRPWVIAALLTPLQMILAILFIWLGLFVAAHTFPDWTTRMLSKRDEPDALLRVTGVSRALLVMILVFIGPLVEEFVFRGLLLQKWIAKWGFWRGLIASAAVFAIPHLQDVLGAFVFGLIAGILFLWSGSLVIPWVIHALNNSVVTAVILLDTSGITRQQDALTVKDVNGQWPGSLLFLLVVGAAVAGLLRPLARQARERITASTAVTANQSSA